MIAKGNWPRICRKWVQWQCPVNGSSRYRFGWFIAFWVRFSIKAIVTGELPDPNSSEKFNYEYVWWWKIIGRSWWTVYEDIPRIIWFFYSKHLLWVTVIEKELLFNLSFLKFWLKKPIFQFYCNITQNSPSIFHTKQGLQLFWRIYHLTMTRMIVFCLTLLFIFNYLDKSVERL